MSKHTNINVDFINDKYAIFRFYFRQTLTKDLLLSRMHLSASVVLITVYLLIHSTVGITEMINHDSIYFPDQAEYIKLATKCPDNLILWPYNRQCYKEGEQGPCNVGRVLVFDDRLFKPYCKDLVF